MSKLKTTHNIFAFSVNYTSIKKRSMEKRMQRGSGTTQHQDSPSQEGHIVTWGIKLTLYSEMLVGVLMNILEKN